MRCEITNNYARDYGGVVWTGGWTTLIDSLSLDNSRGASGYATAGYCANTESNDRGGLARPVSLADCETELTF